MFRTLILAFFVLGVAWAADLCAPVCVDGDGGLYPHPQNCSLFYQCSFGHAYIIECDSGLEFNPVGLYCDYPESSGCKADPEFDCGGSATTVILSSSAQTTTVYPISPSQPISSTTKEPAATTTKEPAGDLCAPVCVDGDEGLYPHPQNCSLFYQCYLGHAFVKQCQSGLYYNPDQLYCDYPDQAGCEADPEIDCGGSDTTVILSSSAQTTPSSTSQQISSTTKEPAATTTKEPATTTSPAPTSADPSACTPPCPSATAIYANPRDCTTYFMCFGGVPYLQTCNPGDEYNPAAQTCEEAGTFVCLAGPGQPCEAVAAAPAPSKLG